MSAEALYTRLADSYDVTLTLAGYKMAVEYFIKHIPLETSKVIRILDAGCGTGFYSLALLRRFPNCRIVAFDLNREMIEKLKEKIDKKGITNRIEVFRADMVSPLPLDPDQFDLIVTAGVLEYVRIEEAVNNLSLYLKKGGYWINSPIKTNLFGKIVGKMYKLRPYSRKKNIEVFRRTGFLLLNIANFLTLKEAHVFQKVAPL
jgi:ubiquinone/menaquinone biosynthesis C-methylase UbiE